MMKATKIITAAAGVLLLCSCGIWRRVPQAPSVEKQDSVRVVVRDSIVTVRDTVVVELPKESETVVTPSQTSHLENSVAESDAQVDTLGLLHHSLKSKKSVLAPVNKTVEVRDSIVYVTRTETKEVAVEREFTKWEKFRLSSWGWLAALVAVFVAVKVTKIVVKIK